MSDRPQKLWLQLRKVLAQRGVSMAESATPAEIAEQVSHGVEADAVRRFVHDYLYKRQFGVTEGVLTDEDAAALVARVASLPAVKGAAAAAGPKMDTRPTAPPSVKTPISTPPQREAFGYVDPEDAAAERERLQREAARKAQEKEQEEARRKQVEEAERRKAAEADRRRRGEAALYAQEAERRKQAEEAERRKAAEAAERRRADVAAAASQQAQAEARAAEARRLQQEAASAARHRAHASARRQMEDEAKRQAIDNTVYQSGTLQQTPALDEKLDGARLESAAIQPEAPTPLETSNAKPDSEERIIFVDPSFFLLRRGAGCLLWAYLLAVGLAICSTAILELTDTPELSWSLAAISLLLTLIFWLPAKFPQLIVWVGIPALGTTAFANAELQYYDSPVHELIRSQFLLIADLIKSPIVWPLFDLTGLIEDEADLGLTVSFIFVFSHYAVSYLLQSFSIWPYAQTSRVIGAGLTLMPDGSMKGGRVVQRF